MYADSAHRFGQNAMRLVILDSSATGAPYLLVHAGHAAMQQCSTLTRCHFIVYAMLVLGIPAPYLSPY